MTLLRALFGTPSRAGTTIALALVVGGLSSCMMSAIAQHRPATPEQIEAALKGNWCMQELMPRRVALDYKDKPMTLEQLELGTNDCKEAAEKHAIIERQKAALAAAVAK